jgi:hypothetical protein
MSHARIVIASIARQAGVSGISVPPSKHAAQRPPTGSPRILAGMSTRRFRYSERLEMVERGALAPLEFDEIPGPFLAAFLHLVDRATKTPRVGGSFFQGLRSSLIEHFGLEWDFDFERLVRLADVPNTLDIVEIVAEEATKLHHYEERSRSGGMVSIRPRSGAAMAICLQSGPFARSRIRKRVGLCPFGANGRLAPRIEASLLRLLRRDCKHHRDRRERALQIEAT